MNERGRNSVKAIRIASDELKKQKKEHQIEFLLLFFALLSTSAVFFMLTWSIITTGFLTYVPANASYITEMNVTLKFQTSFWHGLYGLALRVPGYIDPLLEDVDAGEITSKGLFFNCMQVDALGGREIYASTSPVIDFDTLTPALPSQIDSFTECNTGFDCAENTFLGKMSIMVGPTNITNIPSTYTYRWDGNNGFFDLGILKDGSGNLVYVTHLTEMSKGYSPSTTVNFQMLLPTRAATTETYYFFTDPYDECPEGGGIGDVISATISGYVKNYTGYPLENITVIIDGVSSITNALGFYNIAVDVLEGSKSIFAYGEGYDEYFSNVSIGFNNSIVEKNISMHTYTPSISETILPTVWGYATDPAGMPLEGVNIYLAGVSTSTNSLGFYSLVPEITPESHPIIATSTGYNNYYSILQFFSNTTSLSHNFSMTLTNLGQNNNTYATGPYTQIPEDAKKIKQIAENNGEDYWISNKEIVKEIRQNTFVGDSIGIWNFKQTDMNLLFTISPEISDIVKLNRDAAVIQTGKGEDIEFTYYGTKPVGVYRGTLTISGTIEKEIPITVKIVDKKMPIETLMIAVDLFEEVVNPGRNLNYKITLQNLLIDQEYQVYLEKIIVGENNSVIYYKESENIEIKKALSIINHVEIPSNFSEGNYLFIVNAKYFGSTSSVTAPFSVRRPLYLYSFLGIPVWVFFSVFSFASFVLLNLFIYKRYKAKKKRYGISLDLSTLPKADKKFMRLGLIAETKTMAYLEPERLKTHAIVAGATGMGKSISAQVIVEEALMKNVAVIVFDPTAQWSGLLRKCEDKKMISFYPKFGLKPTDARGFPGNIRKISHARELIDVQKFIHPGQIQIFALNKLDPKDIDTFIASVIRQIFRSDPKEEQDLKVLLVFDEVHRLLSKFGGSGEGFLQIERACREFRKWGMGVILISQVLSDFVGEVKANINTEVQTRTVEESDLERIKTKYGEEFLKSLVRAEVGVAMFQNAEYNKGKPYFINFRPILHNTRRLSDEELEKYNKYNEIIDDFESQVEQLETEKVDIFDLKMELKLIKDKLMTGNFSVVDIYIEGLTPRLQKQWEKIGKKPKKIEKKLLDISEIQKSVEEAKKAREAYEKEEAKKKTGSAQATTQNPVKP